MESKVAIGQFLTVRIGRKWFRIDLFQLIAVVTKKSKTQVKQLNKQNGLEIYIDEKS